MQNYSQLQPCDFQPRQVAKFDMYSKFKITPSCWMFLVLLSESMGVAKFAMCIIYVQNAKWNPGPTPWNFQPHKFEVETHATSLRVSESHVASQKAHTHDMPMSMMGILKMYVKYIVQCRYLGHQLQIYTICILFD